MNWLSWCLFLVTCATWAHHQSPQSFTAPAPSHDRSRFVELTAHRPRPNGTDFGLHCPEALKKAEDEAIALEVLTKRHWGQIWKMKQEHMVFFLG